LNSPVPSRRSNLGKAIRQLCLSVTGLDPSTPVDTDQEVLELVSDVLCAPRLSLLHLGAGSRPLRVSTLGFKLETSPELDDSPILANVIDANEALLIEDISALPMAQAGNKSRYATDSAAVYPVNCQGRTVAVLCLSDISLTVLGQLQKAAGDMELLLAVLGQLCLATQRTESASEPGPSQLSSDEVGTLLRLVEKLDHSLDTQNIFASFCEITESLLPIDGLFVIHDSLSDKQNGSIIVKRPVHWEELQREYGNLSKQWERRHSRSISIDDPETSVLGRELVMFEGSCPDELRCGTCETFPIFIDNDLFALVTLTSDHETFADRRRLKLFSILAHHLMLHIKKTLLMMQNQEMQTVDSLTGLYNERQFYKMMEREFDRACRYNVPLCLLIVDVDHFRDVNETYGFETGDMLLKEISAIIMENVRSTDFVSRYSGERFVVVLPETHTKNGEILANRLRRFVENNSFFISNTNVFFKVTVSIGVSSYLEHKPASLAQFIEFADTALFFSKRNGRNQVVGYSYVINLMMRDTDNES
jgi:diguanylate cyclase (GGDEF)-like protein